MSKPGPVCSLTLSPDQIRALILLIDAYGTGGASDEPLAEARAILRDALRPFKEPPPHA